MMSSSGTFCKREHDPQRAEYCGPKVCAVFTMELARPERGMRLKHGIR